MTTCPFKENTCSQIFLAGVLCAVLLIILSTGCNDEFNDSIIDVDQICSLSNAAFKKQDFDDLLLTFERQFGVARGKMRVTKQGIFIPIKERFIEERGYFVAKPGVSVSGKGSDPAFDQVKECIYRYRIKG